MIKVKILLSYRLIPYEIEIEASDQTDIMYVLGEEFLGKLIEKIQAFIDDTHFKPLEKEKTDQAVLERGD